MRRLGILLLSLALASCAPIQQTSVVSTPTRQQLSAGVGDVIFRAEGRESMPNAFGNADVFGRTRPTGFTLLQYGGIHNGKAVLLRTGIVTQSDATTMNSTGMILPTAQTTSIHGSVGTTPVSGTAVSQGSIYVPPAGSTSTSMQAPAIPIEIDWRRDPNVRIGGHVIVITGADERSISYLVE